MVCFSATIGKIKAHLTKTSIVTENRIDFSVTMLIDSKSRIRTEGRLLRPIPEDRQWTEPGHLSA